MSLSHRAINELRSELQELHRRRTDIDSRITGIEVVLGTVASGINRLKRTDAHEDVSSPVPRRRGSWNGGSLKAHLLEALRRSASGSDANELTTQLSEQGFRVGGDTTLRQRVTHELARLRRKGVLQRRRNKKYVVARKPAPSGRVETPPEHGPTGPLMDRILGATTLPMPSTMPSDASHQDQVSVSNE